MQIRIGYRLVYEFEKATPLLAVVNVHHSRIGDLVAPDTVVTTPSVPLEGYHDGFGNWCHRLVAPAGTFEMAADTVIRDSGQPDEILDDVVQEPVQNLPPETLVYLLPSRYCESDRLPETAWELFGATPPTWQRVQAVSQWVHDHINFGYQWASPSKTACDALAEGRGVCRDYAHLGIALCRALNIPARYCTGYLGDIGVPPSSEPMDFAGWFEVYLSGRWLTVDPRNLVPRRGRILMARGRDASDVAITTTFGPNVLRHFQVWTEEVINPGPP
jgi:transglutaminase-like putative cysteine protease